MWVYTESVICYIDKCIDDGDDVTVVKTIKRQANQKKRTTGEVRQFCSIQPKRENQTRGISSVKRLY